MVDIVRLTPDEEIPDSSIDYVEVYTYRSPDDPSVVLSTILYEVQTAGDAEAFNEPEPLQISHEEALRRAVEFAKWNGLETIYARDASGESG